MKTLTKLLFFSLLVISCQNVNKSIKNELPTFDISQKPTITDVKLSDLGFVDIDYVPLETNKQSITPGVNRIVKPWIVAGDNYFLTRFFNKIYMFRYDGSFVTTVGTEGRGPNEFIIVHDIDIDPQNQYIYLVSGMQNKFFVYSDKGEFIKTFPSPRKTNNFKFTDDGILCYSVNTYADVDTSYTLIDTNGRIIKSYPNRYPWTFGSQGTTGFTENFFYRFNNRLFKKEIYSDTIYEYENMNFKPHLVIELGERLLTPEARTINSSNLLSQNFSLPQNLFEFGDYIYYELGYDFANDGFSTGLIGSKKDNSQKFINSEKGIINDLDGGLSIWPKNIKDDNSIIDWVDANQLKAHVASDLFKNSTPKYPEKKKELEKLAESLNETDNPVLMIVKLKE